jgi:cystathionine beta-lyase/cystathionine gamma-synthase
MAPPTLPAEQKLSIGVTPGLVRLSVGIENVSDLIRDLERALTAV